MKQLTLSFLLALLPLMASADAVEIDGIWYNLVSKVKTAEVTKKPSGKYTGTIEIPEKVPYNGTEYSVTSIGEIAFYECGNLTSVTIPNSVTSIGEYAFTYCSGLTSITIPNSVTSMGQHAFSYCRGLTSVHISDLDAWCKIALGDMANPLNCAHHLFIDGEEIKDLVIPNSVTSIGVYAFSGCSGLTSVTIPNSVTSIGPATFEGCSGLASITIPNSVTSIGGYAFKACSGLTSITIPNNVTSIGGYAFQNCSGLTSVTIPNNVTIIGDYAFEGCDGLTSVTIGNSVKTIGLHAFAQCPELADFYCLAEELTPTNNWGSGPLYTDASAFEGSLIEYTTLHVPASAINTYKITEPWSRFETFVTLSDEEMETPKCALPTISLEDGEIVFGCETEGAEFVSEVTVNEAKAYYDNKISAPKKFKVTVYATKSGYDDSDEVTEEFDFSSDTSRSGDVDGDGKVNVADHVRLSEIIMNQIK